MLIGLPMPAAALDPEVISALANGLLNVFHRSPPVYALKKTRLALLSSDRRLCHPVLPLQLQKHGLGWLTKR